MPDVAHLIRLVQASQVTSAGVDPVAIHIERARLVVGTAGLADRITLHQGVMPNLPYGDGYFDFVWCRDVLEQLDDLDRAQRARPANLMARCAGGRAG
jgi:ubiquinone/menaquinone biosynthesis C-methylase UbiE